MKEVNFKNLKFNPFNLIGNEWMLVTAGSEQSGCNTMTASWGHLGCLWGHNDPTAVIYLRPSRYTKQFVDREGWFTLCVMDKSMKKQMAYLGSVSGRDEDKIAKAGLTPVYDNNSVYFKQAKLVLVCRKVYQSELQESGFLYQQTVDDNYAQRDFHTMYVGKIEKVLVRDGEYVDQAAWTDDKDIYLAGGCFWGTEHYFKQIEGVTATEVGYANGIVENPTYEQVCTDKTRFAETVRVSYNPQVVSLEFLLQMYFKAIDPVSVNQQGHDKGTQYRTGIYYTDSGDVAVIDKVYQEVQKNYPQPLAVEKQPLENFYAAEDYHQDYLDKNPEGYCHLPVSLFEFARQAREKR